MGQSSVGNQKTFVLLKEGQIYYYKNIYLCKADFIWRNFNEFEKSQEFCTDVLTRISNKKKFCQINFCRFKIFCPVKF